MELFKYISMFIIMFFEVAILFASLSEDKDKQFQRRGIIFFIIFLIPLLYIIIK